MAYELEEVLTRIHEAPLGTLVYVGTDSKNSKYWTSFVTVIVLHYEAAFGTGKGCTMRYRAERVQRISSLKQRLIEEVARSTSAAIELMYGTEDIAGVPAEMLEVHADINPDPRHKSYVAYKDAVSYIRGQGLTERFKPDALAASSASDWILRCPNPLYSGDYTKA